jgi:hypothetical protein
MLHREILEAAATFTFLHVYNLLDIVAVALPFYHLIISENVFDWVIFCAIVLSS